MAGPVVLRSQWALRTPQWTQLALPTPKAVEHHSAGPSPGADLIGWLREFERQALRRGDGLIAIAYNWLVISGGPHNGTKVECRPWGVMSGATFGQNNVSQAVCMTGNFETATPTPEAMDSNAELWATAIRGGYVAKVAIDWHGEYYPTACSGMHLIERLPNLDVRISMKLGEKPPPRPVPKPREDTNVQTYKQLRDPDPSEPGGTPGWTRAARVDDSGRIALFGGAKLYCLESDSGGKTAVVPQDTPLGKFIGNDFASGVKYLGSTTWGDPSKNDGFVLLGLRPNAEVAMRHYSFSPID